MEFDPLCAEAALLRQDQARRRALFEAHEPGTALARVVHERQRAEAAEHVASCDACSLRARLCPACGVDPQAARHRLLCPRSERVWGGLFRRAPRARPAPAAPPERRPPTPPRPARPAAQPARPAQPSPEAWAYRALGLAPGANPGKAKAVYRELAKVYHPDRTLHLPPEKRAVAERRMKEINEAYETLTRAWG